MAEERNGKGEALEEGGLDAADDRTLRLAALPVDPAALDRVLRYQERFLAHVEGREGAARDELWARAHAAALEASGVQVHELERVSAVLRAFCGRRGPLQRLKTRLRELERQGAAAEQRRTRLQEELPKLDGTEPLARRYGEETIRLLLEREAEVLALHERLHGLWGGS